MTYKQMLDQNVEQTKELKFLNASLEELHNLIKEERKHNKKVSQYKDIIWTIAAMIIMILGRFVW